MPHLVQAFQAVIKYLAAASVIALLGCLFGLTTEAAASINVDTSSRLIHLPEPVRILRDGTIEVASSKWKTETSPDGTQLLTAKTAEARVALMKTHDGKPESFTAYTLSPVGPSVQKIKQEDSGTIFYSKGQVAAVTSCTNTGLKDSIGRVCVTATPRLCRGLRSTKGIDSEALSEMESYEMRSLAAILTLRGSDHQLENVVNSGNRLGLKNPLQTTKGQLLAIGNPAPHESTPSEKNVFKTSLARLRQFCLVSRF